MTQPEILTTDIESLRQYIIKMANKHNALEELNTNLVREITSLTQDKQSLTTENQSLVKENDLKQKKILKLELQSSNWRRNF